MTLDQPSTPSSVGDLLGATCTILGDAPALGFSADAISYRQLDARVTRIANALHQEAAPGDRIAILGAIRPSRLPCCWRSCAQE